MNDRNSNEGSFFKTSLLQNLDAFTLVYHILVHYQENTKAKIILLLNVNRTGKFKEFEI